MRKRKIIRTPISIPGKFCFSNTSEKWFEITLVNISLEGFCFSTNSKHKEALSEEPVIHVVMEVLESEIVALNFKVIWSGNVGQKVCLSGGEILDLKSENYQKFLKFYNKIIQA